MNESFVVGEERTKRLVAMGQMAASLAHEIRNPLGSMELFCSLLKKDLQSQPDTLRLAEQIHAGIKTLDRIISNCLQFARDTRPKYRSIREISALLEETIDTARAKAEKHDIALEHEESGSGELLIDPYLMKQALLNLILNAIDAVAERAEQTNAPGPNGKDDHFRGFVRIQSDLSDETTWRLKVTDNGVGFEEEASDRIFDPFYTTKNEGTGLGLTVTHSIILAHGGSLSVDSKKGEGTTAIVVIPNRR